jgi:hypothetical protein
VVQETTPPFEESSAEAAQRNADDELDEADKLAQSALERTLIESGSMLLPVGTLEIQPSVSYALSSADGTTDRADVFDIGDVELSLSSHLLRGRGWMPDLLASFCWKTTAAGDPFDVKQGALATGTGFNDLQLSLTSVKVRDPIVLFTNFSAYPLRSAKD